VNFVNTLALCEGEALEGESAFLFLIFFSFYSIKPFFFFLFSILSS